MKKLRKREAQDHIVSTRTRTPGLLASHPTAPFSHVRHCMHGYVTALAPVRVAQKTQNMKAAAGLDLDPKIMLKKPDKERATHRYSGRTRGDFEPG